MEERVSIHGSLAAVLEEFDSIETASFKVGGTRCPIELDKQVEKIDLTNKRICEGMVIDLMAAT